MRIAYMGIEKIQSRYSHQLEDWNREFFHKLPNKDVVFTPIHGIMPPSIIGKIVTGSVLDAHGRTHWSLTQMAKLVANLQIGRFDGNDVIFFEDMFTPGIESLPYIFHQIPVDQRPRVYVRCLAQTVDPDDFIHRTGMFKWMRHYEQMVTNFVDGILVASQEMVAHLHIAGLQDVPIFVTGLPFGKDEVLKRMSDIPVWETRERNVAFAARFDDEKQPQFFMDLVERVYELDQTIKFSVLTGLPKLRSNNSVHTTRARELETAGKLKIFEGLSKNEYYSHLANSRVLFNCALQDWVSNTVSEADTLGAQTLYPAYRSFPETFFNDPRHMYIPWSLEDAASKLIQLVNKQIQDVGRVSDYQNGSLARTLDVFQTGIRSPFLASAPVGNIVSTEYRKHVSESNKPIKK
jgi:hypothetical protein